MAEGTSGKLRRRVKSETGSLQSEEKSEEESKYEDSQNIVQDPSFNKEQRKEWLVGSYWLTRIVFIRALGSIYFVAFLIALHQNKQLIGTKGLLPANLFLQRVRENVLKHSGSTSYLNLLDTVPTLLWWVPNDYLDSALDCTAYIGLSLSAILVIAGSGNVIIFASLWTLYHSISNVGQRWYSFGWESQLLEMGFLAMFMSPVLSLRQYPRHTPTSLVIVWGNRWLIFRIMIGAGLIKIRGDSCWRDLTCMNYHYQTQPVPNPISYYLHQSPEIIHKLETAGNHVIELLVPFLMFLPQPFCAINGFLQILFQAVLIVSGNLSFLNWLTMLPSIFCFDDYMLSWLFSKASVKKVIGLQRERKEGVERPPGFYVRKVVSLSLGLLLAYLSIPVVQNLFSSHQMMNTSFNSLRILNTYGAFGSVTKQRNEVIIEGTYNTTLGKNGELADWEEFEFNCKPGDIYRRPCVISPYHYRLDWLMWFAAFQNFQHNPWLLNVCGKLLAGDPLINSIIAYNPFKEKPPKYIRASLYRYEFTKIGSPEAKAGKWWKRRKIGEYIPIVSEQNLRPVIEQQGWMWYNKDTS